MQTEDHRRSESDAAQSPLAGRNLILEMEPAKGKMRRTSSSLLLRITDICKVHSVAVAENVGKKPNAGSTGGSSEDGAHLKIYPHHHESCSGTSTARYEDAVVEKLLDAVSGLKLAYLKVQQAHVPYDPEKVAAAGEHFVSELEETAGLKDLYFGVSKWSNPMYQSHVSSRIHEHQKLALELQADICKKDSELVLLRAEFEELERRNMELKEEVDRRALFMHREISFDIGKGGSIDMFMELFENSSKCIHDFTKLVISSMKVSGWDLNYSMFPVDKSVVFEKRTDKKYCVEAYFARAMLMVTKEDYFSMDSFYHVMSFKDPFDALVESPNSNFGKFCREKYLVAVPSNMEDSFFGNLDHRAFVKMGGHPRTQFYQTFARMARYVWALLTVARFLKPMAEMFFVKSGVQFQKKHMESVPAKLTTEEAKISVGFTVMPGFKIGCTVIRCRVYLSMLNTRDS